MLSQDFWNSYPRSFGQKEFFKQVGKTVQGEPISADQFQIIVSNIVEFLELKPSDDVLDLCCCNGLLTKEIAERCQSVVGVDFSEFLIERAREHHRPSNARYACRSVTGLTLENLTAPSDTNRYSKIYMYEALQHFDPSDLKPLLRSLVNISIDDVVMLFASVPDRNHIWDFYNTPERKSAYEERIKLGTDSMGTWWDRSFIRNTCEELGLTCERHVQNPILHTAHYRSDWVMRRKV